MYEGQMPVLNFQNVRLSYPLFNSPKEVFWEFLGLNNLWDRSKNRPVFHALKGINLTVNRGDRIGIIGQNGAGKTSLLKLATGNFAPTSGKVTISGKIQSLMDSGLGFHQEFTGRQNILSSLVYNGLTQAQMRQAVEDIINFAELGTFIDQPIKTYSLGMRSRLGFATATAIHPDILIIDEVMGAGDAYFAAKSAERMKNLTKEGVTLLLVSHSMAHITQFCDQVIWVKEGLLHMKGEALEVCKAYAKYMRELDEIRLEKENSKMKFRIQDKDDNSKEQHKVSKDINKQKPKKNSLEESASKQETSGPKDTKDSDMKNIPIDRSISRWNGTGELLIEDFYMLNSEGKKQYTFTSGEEVHFILTVKAREEGDYPCLSNINTMTLEGQTMTVHVHNAGVHYFKKGEIKSFQLTYPDLLLGSGDYVVSVAVYRQLNLDDTSNASFYDLLDRSFQFKVINKHKFDRTRFIHPSRWKVM